jgi:hypothetical protein
MNSLLCSKQIKNFLPDRMHARINLVDASKYPADEGHTKKGLDLSAISGKIRSAAIDSLA